MHEGVCVCLIALSPQDVKLTANNDDYYFVFEDFLYQVSLTLTLPDGHSSIDTPPHTRTHTITHKDTSNRSHTHTHTHTLIHTETQTRTHTHTHTHTHTR